MTGFFRGPSLIVHLFILGTILAVGVPGVAQWMDSVSLALGLGAAVAIFYAIFALVYAVRGTGRPEAKRRSNKTGLS